MDGTKTCLWMLGLLACAACGCATQKPPAHAPRRSALPVTLALDETPAPAQPEFQPPPPVEQSRVTSSVRGISGTLSREEVMSAMEQRKPALDACVRGGKRGMPWVSGDIRFAFKVTETGAPVDVRAVNSDLGHHVLEHCLTTVLAETTFPAPAGRQLTRDVQWRMGVDGVYRAAEPVRPKALGKVLRKHTRDAYKECKAPRGRLRYHVTAYVTPQGRVLSAGAVVLRGGQRAIEHKACLLGQVTRWNMPRVEKRSKVTFRF